jgi:hypothetical protein
MDCEESQQQNKREVWVIRDGKSHIAHNIRQTDKNTISYIGYITLEPSVYMVYGGREQALEALQQINEQNMKYGFDLEFHIEKADWNELIEESIEFRKTKKKNMILIEKILENNTMRLLKKHKRHVDVASMILPILKCLMIGVFLTFDKIA